MLPNGHIFEFKFQMKMEFEIGMKKVYHVTYLWNNGIGPNTACLILSALTVQDVVNAIASQDLHTIQSVKGIGAKTAQRVVMELKDKVAKGSFTVQDNFSSSYNNNKMEALSALVALGFAKNLAEKVLDGIVKSEGSELTVEELIKKALKLL